MNIPKPGEILTCEEESHPYYGKEIKILDAPIQNVCTRGGNMNLIKVQLVSDPSRTGYVSVNSFNT